MELVRKIGPALGSLGIAVVLWLVVHNLDRSPARFVVPITYEAPADVVVLADRTSEVEVQVRATKPKLRTLQATAFVVRVQHLPGRFGRAFVVLDPSDVEAPFGVTVERVSPSQLWVTYDRRLTRTVPVHLDVGGKPAAGHEVVLAEARMSPVEVTLSGPESFFGPNVVVKTERIDVDGRATPLVLPHVALVPPGPNFTLGRGADVDVTIPVRPIRHRRTFDEVSVDVVGGGWRISRPNPKAIRVTVEGDEAEVMALRPANVRARVDASQLQPRAEDYRLEPEVEVDVEACPSCRVVGRHPGRVDLSVTAGKPSRRRSSLEGHRPVHGAAAGRAS